MKRFMFLVFGFLGFLCLLPSSAEAQYGFGRRASDVLRQIEARRAQIKNCAENSQSDWAFEECLRGRPLAGVIEGNRALVDDIADAGHGYDGYGSTDSIVRGSVWGSGRDRGRVRQERRLSRTIISPVEGGITTGVIMGAATRSVRNGVVYGAAAYGGLRVLDAVLERRERSKMERKLRQEEEAEARMREVEEVEKAATSKKSGRGASFRSTEGKFKITNASSAIIEVFDDGQEEFSFEMQPGEVRRVPRPRGNYIARAQIPNNYGGVWEGELERFSDNNGWTFEEPAVTRR